MKRLIIIGAGGQGRVCACIAQKLNKYEKINFFDDNKSGNINNIEILNGDIQFFINAETDFFVAIGDNEIRKNKILDLQNWQANIATLVDPTAIISSTVQIGTGSAIMPNVVINTDAVIGNGVIVNTSSIIEHDCVIENYVRISPNTTLGGMVTIRELSQIGIGSIIINNIEITQNVIIGAGAVVVKNIFESGIYVGIPAKKKEKL